MSGETRTDTEKKADAGAADERERGAPRVFDLISRSLLIGFALIAAGAAVARMFADDDKTRARFDETTLLYLGVAAGLLLLREVKSFAFGDYKIEFERAIAIAKKAQTTAENAQQTALGVGKAEEETEEGRARASLTGEEIRPGTYPNDPWRGQFGGEEERNDRKLEAEVSKIAGTHLFNVRLRVRSTLPRQNPLRGVVQFFLHDTFRNQKPVVTVGPDGVAELKLRAWGAFTVGALADEGQTRLELNLAELETAPMEFRQR